jgi:hypothetical protein
MSWIAQKGNVMTSIDTTTTIARRQQAFIHSEH